MDIELFLEGQAKWKADSPHHLMMLYKMFCHTMDQGQKEAEQMVHQGCQQELPKLDPEVDLSAIQLVGPHTSKIEIVFVSQGTQAVETTGVSTWRAGADGGGSVLLQ